MRAGAIVMATTLVLPDSVADQIHSAALKPLETAGVLLASIVENGGEIRILAREVIWVADAAYSIRECNRLSIASDGYVPALGRAEQISATAIWFHTHPGKDSDPRPSTHDEDVDRQIADLFRLRTGSAYYGALIVSPTSGGLSFSGHLDPINGDAVQISRIFVAGDRFRVFHAEPHGEQGLSPVFDRNIRAFGSQIQYTLGDLTIGIAGCGGTGSAIAEQLIRLGVRRLLLVDPDELSPSNVTRVYGSTPNDVGKRKVEVIRNHLRQIAPDAKVDAIAGMITLEPIAKALSRCDLLFGCTDDNAGRLVLSRIATYLLIPVIDCGVLLSSRDSGEIDGIHGRVTVLLPGQACLVCRNRIDLGRASAELLTPDERIRLVNEGYAPALGRIEPAVIAFTTSVAAAAVTELLERLIGYGPEPRPTEILLRYHDREISTNIAQPRDRHYCNPLSGKTGLGVTEPFLEQTWPQ
jgi:molybdopterin/thiamine biosynthesis adenylyltransferase